MTCIDVHTLEDGHRAIPWKILTVYRELWLPENMGAEALVWFIGGDWREVSKKEGRERVQKSEIEIKWCGFPNFE